MKSLLTTIASIVTLAVAALGATVGTAFACAGLIGSNGAVNLGKTTTLAAYHDGVEHYITAFQFQGGGGQFGTLIPLPGVPTKVERGGGWTLQRLVRETQPQVLAAQSARDVLESKAGAEVLLEVRIDALDITVLKGGGADVAVWAKEHGFRLSPDAPEVLAFYAERSPIFLAAVFDGSAAAERGQAVGDGTPVHLTIPTDNPWVPLRILTLGKKSSDRVEAGVFLLTDRKPAILLGSGNELELAHSAKATSNLLNDLREDVGMEWVPASAWLTEVTVDANAGDLDFDLAVDASGKDNPSRVAAGLEPPAKGGADYASRIAAGLEPPAKGGKDYPVALIAAVVAGVAMLGAVAFRINKASVAPS